MTKVLNLSDLLFAVEKVEITEFQCNSDYSHDVYVYPIFDGVPQKIRVNACSERYELVPNAMIFPVIEQIFLQFGIAYSVEYQMINHARFYVKYTIEDERYAYKVAGNEHDIVKPQLIVMHSYNGLTKYKIMFGYFRLVCTNGLTIAVEDMKEYNLSIVGKHTASILNSLQRLSEIIGLFAENAESICNRITSRFDLLANSIPANVTDRINSILEKSDIKPIENSKFSTFNYILQRAEFEADNYYGGIVNDWLIYNAINAYLNDDTLNIAVPEKRMEKDSQVFEFMLKSLTSEPQEPDTEFDGAKYLLPANVEPEPQE